MQVVQSPYEETSNNFVVRVVPLYMEAQSSPLESKYVFTYGVKITNLGFKPAKLLRRYWKINDGSGDKHDVEGEGVVGKQPMIQPGESFTYQSYCPLKSSTGNMRGRYLMEDEEGNKFSIIIPVFFLRTFDCARNKHKLYQQIDDVTVSQIF